MYIKNILLTPGKVTVWYGSHTCDDSTRYINCLNRITVIWLPVSSCEGYECSPVVPLKMVNVLTLFSMLKDICILRFTILNVYDSFYQAVVLFYSFMIAKEKFIWSDWKCLLTH